MEQREFSFPSNHLSEPTWLDAGPAWLGAECLFSGVSFLPLLLSHHLFVPPPSPRSVPEVWGPLEVALGPFCLERISFQVNTPLAHLTQDLAGGLRGGGGAGHSPDTGSSPDGGEGTRRRGEWAPRGLGQTWEDVGGNYQNPGYPRRAGVEGAARVTARRGGCERTYPHSGPRTC